MARASMVFVLETAGSQTSIRCWLTSLSLLVLLGGTVQAASSPAAVSLYAEAADLQSQGAFDRAAVAWRKFIAEHKSDERIARALYNLGVCCYQQGQYPEALAAFEQVVADHRQSDVAISAQLHRGATQFAMARAGRPALYEQAAATLAELVAKHAQGDHLPDACYYLAESYYALGRHADAARWYGRLTKEFPNHRFAAESLYALASIQEQMRELDAAAKNYDVVVARFPQFRFLAEARLGAARCRVIESRHNEAAEPLRQLVASGTPAAAEAAHWLAQSLVQQKQPQEALAVLEQVAPVAAKTSWAARLLVDRADALAAIADRRKEAISAYAEMAARYPKDPAAVYSLFRAGFVALEAGKYAEALRYATKFASEQPKHALTPDALQIQAESLLQLGQLAEAAALFGRLVKEYRDHPAVDAWKLRRALALHGLKQHEEAIRFLEPCIRDLRSADDIAEAHYIVGASWLALKQPAKAVASLTASIEAQAKWRQSDRVWLALIEAHRLAGDLRASEAAARRLLEAFPESPVADPAQFQLGVGLSRTGQTAAAADAFRELIARWPKSPLVPLAMHELGCVQLAANDAAGAEATFTSVLERSIAPPAARKARYGRAMARCQQNKFAEAAADLEAVLASSPDAGEKSDARFLLGVCQAELKRHRDAAATFETLLKENPSYPARDEALFRWASALDRLGRKAEAAAILAKFPAEHPQSPRLPDAVFRLAESHFQSKNYAAAAQAYYLLVQNPAAGPLAEKAAWQLAQCYYRQGNWSDAKEAFAYFRGKHPNHPEVAEAAFFEAECLFKQGLAAEALAAYSKLKPPPEREARAAMFLHAGQAAAQLGRWSESAAWLERLTRELPDAAVISEAFCELGAARQNLGMLNEAAAAYEAAIAKGDREPAARAQFLIGKIHWQQKNVKQALDSFLKTVYGYSYPKWQAPAALEAARCYAALGQKSQAAGMYQHVIDNFPQSGEAAEARKRLNGNEFQ